MTAETFTAVTANAQSIFDAGNKALVPTGDFVPGWPPGLEPHTLTTVHNQIVDYRGRPQIVARLANIAGLPFMPGTEKERNASKISADDDGLYLDCALLRRGELTANISTHFFRRSEAELLDKRIEQDDASNFESWENRQRVAVDYATITAETHPRLWKKAEAHSGDGTEVDSVEFGRVLNRLQGRHITEALATLGLTTLVGLDQTRIRKSRQIVTFSPTQIQTLLNVMKPIN